MWQLTSILRGEEVALPPGTYHAPAYYNPSQLEQLAILLSRLIRGVQYVHVLTWEQTNFLAQHPSPSQGSLLVLHGDAGVKYGETDSLEDTLFARADLIPATWRLVQVPRSRLTKLAWMTRYLNGPLLALLREHFSDEAHPLHACSIQHFPLQLAATLTIDPLELSQLIEQTIQHRLTFAQDGRRFRPQDWERSLAWIAGRTLAGRGRDEDRYFFIDSARVLAMKLMANLLEAEATPQSSNIAVEYLVKIGLADAWGGHTAFAPLARAPILDEVVKKSFVYHARINESQIPPDMLWASDFLQMRPVIQDEWIEKARENKQQEYVTHLQMAARSTSYANLLEEMKATKSNRNFEDTASEPGEMFHVYIMEALRQSMIFHLLDPSKEKQFDEKQKKAIKTLYHRHTLKAPGRFFRAPNTLSPASVFVELTNPLSIDGWKELSKDIGHSDTSTSLATKYAKALIELGLVEIAISFLSQLFVFGRSAEFHLFFARILRDHGKLNAEANSKFQFALDEAPENTTITKEYARFLSQAIGDLDRAEALYARAWRLAPEDRELAREFAEFLRKERDDEAWAAEVEAYR